MSHITSAAVTSAGNGTAGFAASPPLSSAVVTGYRLDKFYTKHAVALQCYQRLPNHYHLTKYQLVEPSAGDGVFSDLMPGDRIAIDADPQGPGIIRGDYLKTTILSDRPIMVVGNPPFGRCSTLAVKFFLHAAETAQVIAFILPRSACRATFVRRLPLNWHLVHEELIPPNSFLTNSQVRDVPTVFMIWERRDTVRVMPPARASHPHFEVADSGTATFAIQRIGANAGRILDQWNPGASSPYFVKAVDPGVRAVMSSVDFSDCTKNNAGVPVISLEEIINTYDDALAGRYGRYKRPLAPLLPGDADSCLCCRADWPFR